MRLKAQNDTGIKHKLGPICQLDVKVSVKRYVLITCGSLPYKSPIRQISADLIV